MQNFFVEYWPSILLSLTTAGLLFLCKTFYAQAQNYRMLLDNQERDYTEELIDKKLEPITQELEDLRVYIRETKDIEKSHMSLIIASYKYRLTQLCKCYMKQGYMTQDQYEQLSEFYKLYTALGGNGQAKEYYEKTVGLPIHE